MMMTLGGMASIDLGAHMFLPGLLMIDRLLMPHYDECRHLGLSLNHFCKKLAIWDHLGSKYYMNFDRCERSMTNGDLWANKHNCWRSGGFRATSLHSATKSGHLEIWLYKIQRRRISECARALQRLFQNEE
ncbi:hypothetical protein KIN20_017986 [Parelaphostrongylus tenuis]|uniref:Uncharacterized protein n=1 Tax=Parelaphostrongylus tenuis TaxID=148309 RepID=A0AAD5QP34_PARTN|nr:hypothetical protein KIN20_017986 [Parelaphostrongylus tenuis]